MTETLHWWKCENKNGNLVWCPLEQLNLNTATEEGVYIIWYENEESRRCVYVGQGDVDDRLGKHKKDPDILRHKKLGTLYVTWADIPKSKRNGVERFLADVLEPLEGEQHPNDPHIAVNLPCF